MSGKQSDGEDESSPGESGQDESGQDESDQGNDGGSERRDRTSPLEWVVAGISALLVLATAAFLLYDALGSAETPPLITVEVASVVAVGGGYLVEFRARNRGQETAAGLVVEGEIHGDTGVVERSRVTVDYVAAQGAAGGGLFFTRDPRGLGNRLEVRPVGYARP